MAFVKGKSGNPSGRPKEDPEFKELAQRHCSMALERLVFWAKSDNPKASVTAAIHILDRGYGKATQELNANVSVTLASLVEMSLPNAGSG